MMAELASAPPTVTVVVPTRGRPDPVRQCVAALADQDYPATRMQIIVVDDGGPPPDLAQYSGAADLVLLHQHNQGPAAARNRGAREAGGRILAFTDDDCRPRRDWLSRLVPVLEAEPWVMAGGRVMNGLTDNLWARASQDLVSFLYEAFESSRSLRPFFTTNNVAVERDRFLSIGGFDVGFPLPAAEDRDLSERWARDVGPLRFVGDAVVDHFHELGAGSFARQHYGYGRGAVQLARRRRERGEGVPVPEPLSFYFRMISFPFRRQPGMRGLAASGLVAASQLIGLTGMAREALSLLARGRR